MDQRQAQALGSYLAADEDKRRRAAHQEAYREELKKYQGKYRDMAVSGVLPAHLLAVVRKGGW